VPRDSETKNKWGERLHRLGFAARSALSMLVVTASAIRS
jgi:hypothetical protein